MDSLARRLPDKRQFANAVRDFVNRAARSPASPALELISFGAAGVATIAGPFGTENLPIVERAMFWFVLMAWSAVKWRFWFAWMVRGHTDWSRASAVGAVLLNLTLPFEISLIVGLVDVEARVGWRTAWWDSLATAVVVAWTVWSLARLGRRAAQVAPPAKHGPLVRSGTRVEQVGAVRAEDHYCRLFFADGSSRLVLCRFADALAELAHLEGGRIHRSAWVADWAVERGERVGRAWRLVAAGQRFQVSAAHVGDARRRGWLNRG